MSQPGDDEVDLIRVQLSGRYFITDKQPNCNICGRFATAARNTDGKIIRHPNGKVAGWYFPCVIYDSYMGAWEHE